MKKMPVDNPGDFLSSNRMKRPDTKSENERSGKRLPVGWIIDVTVSSLNPEGYGVATYEGLSVLVTGALPGEEVRAKVTFTGRREVYADVVKVMRRSNSRLVAPPCSRPPSCDGCPLVPMNYPSQLVWKKGLVEREVRRFASLRDTIVHDVIASPEPVSYRTSAKLVITGKFAEPLIGIYRRNSHDVVDISDCPLHHPLINRIAQVVKEGIKKGKVPIFSLRNGNGLLRYLVIRVSATMNKAMVVFVTSMRSFNEIHHLAKYLQEKVPEVAVVVQNVNKSAGNVIMGQQDHYLTTTRVLTEKVGNVSFNVSPRSFFQVNTKAAQIIYEKVREWGIHSGKEAVVDLYCGVGGISLFLAPKVREVLGIEVVEAAVADAELNASANGVGNARFVAGDASDILKGLSLQKVTIDLLVINPPRKGCDEKVLLHASAIAPAKIIYVSCSPFTLARDLDILSGKGYRTVAIQPVDMFPQTAHIENVALLERR